MNQIVCWYSGPCTGDPCFCGYSLKHKLSSRVPAPRSPLPPFPRARMSALMRAIWITGAGGVLDQESFEEKTPEESLPLPVIRVGVEPPDDDG